MSTPTPAPTFTVSGTVNGLGDVTITWTPDGGFNDPSGNTAALIADGEEVCSTLLGPCYMAAGKPAIVAYMTALAALDTVTDVDPAMQAQLVELSAVPDGAVS